MPATVTRRIQPVPHTQATFEGGLWGSRVGTNRRATLEFVYDQLKQTGRIDAFRLEWRPGQPNPPHHFWDSDVAKWLEAACYELAAQPEPELAARVDEVAGLIAASQQPDGYLNSYYTVVAPGQRWTNLRDMHELYCAGHLMEAAVAHHAATGSRTLLDTLTRCADHIGRTFGPGKGQKRGYPGHEEIELALVKLYHATGEPRYLELARFFIDERGTQPYYYDQEAEARGEDPARRPRAYDYCQAHLPVREQATAEGHSVRAMYLYSGMADLAAETGDEALLRALRRLWDNVVERRMYVTGGLGSTRHGERFTVDWDLPNDTAYAETCAAIGLIFWAARMLALEADGRYADVLERALYNGFLSGISLDGTHFFYANPLAVDPANYKAAFAPRRQEWFGCSCCPTNVVRLLASLSGYVYGQSGDTAWVHLYAEGSGRIALDGGSVQVRQQTRYPWDGTVLLSVEPDSPREFTLALRLPGWCRGASVEVNSRAVDLGSVAERGYAHLRRLWERGDTVKLTLPMPVERIESHPEVRPNAGRVALQRGPVVYCLEQVDNGANLDALALPDSAALHAFHDPSVLGGCTIVTGEALRTPTTGWDHTLYRPLASGPARVPIEAVPYALWANRGEGEMIVWVRRVP